MIGAGYSAWLSGAGGEKLRTWKQFAEHFGLIDKADYSMGKREVKEMTERLLKYV